MVDLASVAQWLGCHPVTEELWVRFLEGNIPGLCICSLVWACEVPTSVRVEDSLSCIHGSLSPSLSINISLGEE